MELSYVTSDFFVVIIQAVPFGMKWEEVNFEQKEIRQWSQNDRT